jgi:hypothetical protein
MEYRTIKRGNPKNIPLLIIEKQNAMIKKNRNTAIEAEKDQKVSLTFNELVALYHCLMVWELVFAIVKVPDNIKNNPKLKQGIVLTKVFFCVKKQQLEGS